MQRFFLAAVFLFTSAGVARARVSGSISSTRSQFIYVGTDNAIDIALCGINCNEIRVVCTNGEIVKSDDCRFSIRVKNPGSCIVRLITVKRGDTTTIAERRFSVRQLPSPIARVANKTGGEVSAAALRVQLGVAAAMEGLDICATVRIKRFKFLLLRKSGSWQEYSTSEGPFFSAGMVEAMKTIEAGDRVFITDITADTPGNVDGKLEPLFFTIV